MKTIIIIEKDGDNWKRSWWLKRIVMIEMIKKISIVIKKIHAYNKINFSSNANEVIKTVLNSLKIKNAFKNI